MKISRRKCISWLASSIVIARLPEKTLVQRWQDIAAGIDGVVGAAALHLETGALTVMHGDDKFPLASVCKLPLAMHILAMVDEGKFALTDVIEIPSYAVWPNVSEIADHWPTQRRYALSDILRLMVAKSDNTAVELLWRMGGAAPAMARRFRQWNVAGIRLDRSERECGLSQFGITRFPKPEEWTPTLLNELTSKVPAGERLAAMKAFIADPRDTGTPRGTVELLRRTFRGEILSPSSTAFLIQILEATTTGRLRLKGLLPRETVVAHKTGTTDTQQGLNAGTNDVGVITLPKTGRFAIAVYIKGSTRSQDAREKAIAQIARSAYDTFSK